MLSIFRKKTFYCYQLSKALKEFGDRFDHNMTVLSNGNQISRATRHQPSNYTTQKKSNKTLALETDNNTILLPPRLTKLKIAVHCWREGTTIWSKSQFLRPLKAHQSKNIVSLDHKKQKGKGVFVFYLVADK